MQRENLAAAALGALTTIAMILLPSPDAHAFCGFYVSGADKEMYNNATMVVMMREGTKTVLSMRNNYEGPPEDFAMVIPVPQVLEEENVKVLDGAVFTHVDKLAAPRLVEYWEQDPCMPRLPEGAARGAGRRFESASIEEKEDKSSDFGVKIEAQFDVGEYNVVILSAKESNGLEKYLEAEKYNIPEGAAPVLKPYIEGGQYFFVAKVDPKKVKFKDGQARLSPLRFHYDSKEFSLPVRLGLLNAKGHQDLLVHILAKKQRYEVANYKNVTIPTNIFVKDHVRERFGEFYATLLDRTLEENPKAVITEYAWDASTCDPCPTPGLTPGEILTLGGDITGQRWGLVLTRLHARYTKEELGEDLVFKQAPPIIGGRGTPHGVEPKLSEQGSRETAGGYNNFQGRYIMLNKWEGKIECENPQRGVWGGPTSGSRKDATPEAAQDIAFVTRGKFDLPASLAQEGVPGLELKAGQGGAPTKKEDAPAETTETEREESASAPTKKEKKKSSQCGVASQTAPGAPAGLLVLALIGLLGRRRDPKPRR